MVRPPRASGAELTGSPVFHSPASATHGRLAALVTSQTRMSLSGKVLLKKPLSHPERSSAAFCPQSLRCVRQVAQRLRGSLAARSL